MNENLNFLKEKKVLITGGTGYIGANLQNSIAEYCQECTILGGNTPYVKLTDSYTDINIVDEESLLNFFRNNEFDIIYHLAALINVGDSIKNPKKYFSVNTTGTRNVLEVIRKTQANPTVIFNSTGLVYGNAKELPIKEEHAIKPNNPYAASKAAAEDTIIEYSQTYGFTSTILRFFTVYGPNQKAELFVPSLIKRCFKDEKIRVGNLYPTRDFLYIDDGILALIEAMKLNNDKVNIFNIANGEEHKIENIVSIILEMTQRKKEDLLQDPLLVRPREAEIERIVVDISKAKRELLWEPKVNVNEGLAKCVNKYKESILS